MKEIPGYAYLTVGLIVSIMSAVINHKKLVFFIFIGIVMALIGLVKLFFGFLKKEKEPIHNRRNNHQHKNHDRPKCPSCGAIRYPSFNFCPICGNNLKQH